MVFIHLFHTNNYKLTTSNIFTLIVSYFQAMMPFNTKHFSAQGLGARNGKMGLLWPQNKLDISH